MTTLKKHSINIELNNYFLLSETDKNEISLLLRAAFIKNFTGLLSHSQIELFLTKSLSSGQKVNVAIGRDLNDHIISCAFIGQETSLLKSISFRSWASRKDSLGLLLKLLLKPRVALKTIINLAAKRSQRANKEYLETDYWEYLLYIAVSKDYRQYSLGTKMLNHLEKQIASSEKNGIYCHYNGKDSKIESFYLTNGWNQLGEVEASRRLAYKELN